MFLHTLLLPSVEFDYRFLFSEWDRLRLNEGRYTNGTYLVWDVIPRNVLVDADGDMYVIDAETCGLWQV